MASTQLAVWQVRQPSKLATSHFLAKLAKIIDSVNRPVNAMLPYVDIAQGMKPFPVPDHEYLYNLKFYIFNSCCTLL